MNWQCLLDRWIYFYLQVDFVWNVCSVLFCKNTQMYTCSFISKDLVTWKYKNVNNGIYVAGIWFLSWSVRNELAFFRVMGKMLKQNGYIEMVDLKEIFYFF